MNKAFNGECSNDQVKECLEVDSSFPNVEINGLSHLFNYGNQVKD